MDRQHFRVSCVYGTARFNQSIKLGKIGQRQNDLSLAKNIIHFPLINLNKVLLPPFHIKRRLIKQFAKDLNKESNCFAYLCEKFPVLSTENLRKEIFDGPQIPRLVQDKYFPLTIKILEQSAWQPFTAVAENFLRNFKAPNYHKFLKQLFNSYEKLGCNMKVKVYFRHSHANYFPKNLARIYV